jgi:hypothetical protein
MDPKKRKQRRMLILALLVVGVIAATGAYAYWTLGGSGSGTAQTGTANDVTVNQTSTVSGLYPNGPAQGLSGNFDNPNANAVVVSNVSAVVTGTSNAGCTSADFAIAGASTIGNGGVVASGNGQGSWSGLTLQLIDTGVNQDACKNVTVNIAYTAS